MELSNGVIQERQQFIKSMTEFVEEKQKRLNEVLERLGLSAEELLKSEEKKVCPYNKGHIIPAKSFNKHTESCKLLSAGYQKDELPSLLQDVDFCYKNLETGMKIELDEKLLNKIIWDSCVQNGQVYTGHRTMPVSHIDEDIMLTQDDRLAVYNYVVKKSHEAGRVIPVDRTDELLTTDWGSLVKKGLLDEQNNKQYSSKLEQLLALRDLKRRRQSYRAKNVHITKKSYTEIIREVILNQMEILVPSGGTNVTSSADQEDTHKPQITNKHENRGKDMRRDYSSCEREGRRREYIEKNDDDKGRSEGRSRGVHSQRYKRQDRSHERYGDRKVRDRKRSRSRDRSHERAKIIKEEDDSYSSNKDRPSASTEGINLLSSVNAADGPLPDTAEESAGHVIAQGTESTAETASYINLPEESQKQNLSDSDSSSSKKHGKHKKSKHKKKHRKKHKRRD